MESSSGVNERSSDGPSKADLEQKKLLLEIHELERWWRRPAYVQAIASSLVTLLIAGATVSVGYLNGWFDAQRIRLEFQRSEIQREIQQLQSGKTILNDQVRTLTEERDEIRRQREKGSKELASMSGQIRKLAVERDNIRRDKDTLSNMFENSVAKRLLFMDRARVALWKDFSLNLIRCAGNGRTTPVPDQQQETCVAELLKGVREQIQAQTDATTALC